MLKPGIGGVSFYNMRKFGQREISLRIDECLVDSLSLVVTSVLLACLLFESLSLVEGIVQLGVRIGQFLGSALETYTRLAGHRRDLINLYLRIPRIARRDLVALGVS